MQILPSNRHGRVFSFHRRLLPAGLLLALAAACGTSGSSSLTQISNAFCTRAAACCSGIDMAGCPNVVSSLYVDVGFDTSSNYATSSVNQCVSEILVVACPTSGTCTLNIPADCPANGKVLTITGANADDAGTGAD